MNELQKAIEFGLAGKDMEQYLESFRLQINKWNVAMPHVEPLVSDFCLGEFKKTGLIEMWIANEIEAGYCGKYLFVFDGQTCPKHLHRNKIETFHIVKGKVVMQYKGKEINMLAGDILLIERDEYHSFTGLGPALLLEISTPCIVSDNYFENIAIPIGGNYLGAGKC
jgi:quercetin dioxygenase-like cupin family protein